MNFKFKTKHPKLILLLLIILLIIGAILLLGDDLLEWLFCDDMALIWIVLLILLLTNFGFDGGCC